MSATLFLRIAAVIALLNGAGHTAGAPWTPATDTAQLATIAAMKGLWQLGALAKTAAARLRGVMAAFLAASLANAYLGWKYFFAIPTAMSIAIALCLVIALLLAGKAPQPSVPDR
ncbi:MAG TPA: hypothetical protein VH438_11295 [Gemmatimonadales bacterium]|jgi:hypothetical protein